MPPRGSSHQQTRRSSDYDRQHVIMRQRRRSTGTSGSNNRYLQSKSVHISNATIQVSPAAQTLGPSQFGESGENAELSQPAGTDSDSDNEQVPKPTHEVLQSVLAMLNCIGAGLTMDSTDTLRAYSYDMKPHRAYPEGPVLCTSCRPDADDVMTHECENCHDMLLLLHNIEQVTRKIYAVVARPSFSVHEPADALHSEVLRDEVRYRQTVIRPFKKRNDNDTPRQ